MGINSFFSEVKTAIIHSEWFARPAKQIIGEWHLFEYYLDRDKELHHVEEVQLKNEKSSWQLKFSPEGNFTHQKNLEIQILQNIENGTYGISKNFICFIHPSDFRNTIEFQFAISKGVLKILKKNTKGEIDFFGFFKKQE